MNAVGIDVSKGRSTVTVLRPLGEIVFPPFEVRHTACGIQTLVKRLNSLPDECRVAMECTGRYHEALAVRLSEAGFFVSTVNPKLIKDFDNNSLRKVKTDKADSVKIARYVLDKWQDLQQYSVMDELRSQLKTMNRQFGFFMKHKTAMKNNLVAVLDMAYPGVNTFFDSPVRDDGSQKWVDFATTYWHADCVRKMSLNAFVSHYQKWCKRKRYNFTRTTAESIHAMSKELVPILPKSEQTRFLVKQAIDQLNAISSTVESLRNRMNETASQLPEYKIVMSMTGVGPTLGPQLMAEIGDVARFTHKSAITAFSGVDPGVNDSGDKNQKSVPITRRGSSSLRKTLFQIMEVLITTKPEHDPVYQFINKKRAEGKPYYVYMTAGANKFLRIYYGKVKEFLSTLPK